MHNCTKEIVDKGQNIIKVLETLQKRIDKRARTSLLNFFIADDTPGDFSLLDDSISNKSDKCKSELIQNVITELNWNIAMIQKKFSTPL